MIINQTNLEAAFIGFKTLFNEAVQATPVSWTSIATQTPSTTETEMYPWLGQTTKFREWIGPRALQGLSTHGFSIKNKHWEDTVAIPRDKFEDDTYGIYSPVISQLGVDSKVHPDILIYNLIKQSNAVLCYDGQNFFDTDHPGFDENGAPTSVANYAPAEGGTPWYLLCTTQVVKPFIYQLRKPYQFIPRTRPDDPAVFDRNEFVYGVDGRSNVGVGLWQFAYRSELPLNSDNYGAARAAMMSVRRDNGDSMAIMPDTLMVPPSLEGAGNTIVKADVINQTSNVWKDTAKLLVAPRLA